MRYQTDSSPNVLFGHQVGRPEVACVALPMQDCCVDSGRAVGQVSGFVGLVVVVVVVAASPRPSVIAGLATIGSLVRPR